MDEISALLVNLPVLANPLAIRQAAEAYARRVAWNAVNFSRNRTAAHLRYLRRKRLAREEYVKTVQNQPL